MSADKCFHCKSTNVITHDDQGDGCCARCLPLLDDESRCGHCDGDGIPVKMLGLWPACLDCLNRHHLAARTMSTVRATIEAIASEAGLTGSWEQLTVADFVTRVLEARCTRLGLVKSRDPMDAGERRNVANDR